MCTHTYIYSYIHINIYTFTYIDIYIYIYVYYTYIHSIRAYIRMYMSWGNVWGKCATQNGMGELSGGNCPGVNCPGRIVLHSPESTTSMVRHSQNPNVLA